MVAVEGTTLDIYRDQITAIVGENGAGKTTTMDMIVGKFFFSYLTIPINLAQMSNNYFIAM